MSDASPMQIERGWSSSLDRKLLRGLARWIPLRPFRLKGESAVASITFDDVPDSAVSAGAPILERAGVAGTFYVALGTLGLEDTYWRVCSAEQVRALVEGGHEIGCHTASHINVQSLRAVDLERECDLNAEFLANLAGPRPLNFAYPFGDFGIGQASVLGRRFRSCRTIYEHLNAGTIDLAKVSAIGLFDATMTREKLVALVREAQARKAWLVFYTHDVSPEPTFMGTSPRLMQETLAILADHGVACLSVEAALRHHGLPPA